MGLGTFASKNIKKGEHISEFEGPLVIVDSFDGIPQEVQDLLFPIGFNKYLAAKEPTVRINHSCEPNAGIIGETTLVAMRDIKKDEEVTFDYSIVTADDWSLECSCGSKNCRKTIQKYADLSKKVKQKYKNYVPDWILKLS